MPLLCTRSQGRRRWSKGVGVNTGVLMMEAQLRGKHRQTDKSREWRIIKFVFKVQTEGIRSYHDMNVPYTVLTSFGSGRKENRSFQFWRLIVLLCAECNAQQCSNVSRVCHSTTQYWTYINQKCQKWKIYCLVKLNYTNYITLALILSATVSGLVSCITRSPCL